MIPASSSSSRMAEYIAVLDNTAKLSDRRQTTNDVFVGLNSLFLTALGFLFVSTHLTTWWTTAAFLAVAIFTTIINNIWLRLNHRYKTLVGIRISYLTAIESGFHEEGLKELSVVYPDRKGNPINPPAKVYGVHQLEGQTYVYQGGPKVGFSALERSLILVIIATYYILTAVVGTLTYLVTYHIIPGIDLIH